MSDQINQNQPVQEEVSLSELLQVRRDKLAELLEKKARQVKAKNRYDLKDKLIRFGLYRGFDLDTLLPVAAKIAASKFSEETSDD